MTLSTIRNRVTPPTPAFQPRPQGHLFCDRSFLTLSRKYGLYGDDCILYDTISSSRNHNVLNNISLSSFKILAKINTNLRKIAFRLFSMQTLPCSLREEGCSIASIRQFLHTRVISQRKLQKWEYCVALLWQGVSRGWSAVFTTNIIKIKLSTTSSNTCTEVPSNFGSKNNSPFEGVAAIKLEREI